MQRMVGDSRSAECALPTMYAAALVKKLQYIENLQNLSIFPYF